MRDQGVPRDQWSVNMVRLQEAILKDEEAKRRADRE